MQHKTRNYIELLGYLEEKDVNYRLSRFNKSQRLKTVKEMTYTGLPEEKIVKTLIWVTENCNIATISPGAYKVDAQKIAMQLKKNYVRLATEEEVISYSGYLPGSVPPVYHKNIQYIIVDESLLKKKTIVGGGGSTNVCIELSVEDIINLTNAIVTDIKPDS